MTEQQSFEALKQQAADDMERRVGAPVRQHFGPEAMEPVYAAILSLTPEQYESWKRVDETLIKELNAAVWKGLDPVTEEGQRIAYLHRRWITIVGQLPYDPRGHRKLVELGTEEGRFNARYEKVVPGCSNFLRDAIRAYVKTMWGAWETGKL